MKLFLVRHGEYLKNEAQSLSEKGMADIQKIAQFLKNAKIEVDIFYHSTKTRAKQTAEILQGVLNPNAEVCVRDYLSPNDATEKVVTDISGFTKNTMIVGHLPFLSNLTSRLLVGKEEEAFVAIGAGSVVILENDSSQNWYVVSLITPALL